MKQVVNHARSLEIIAFVTGFALMAFELAAARILAPSIGSSTYVWTSVIGVIIMALSLGYWLGGRLADARKAASDVVRLLLLTAAMIVLMQVLYVDTLAIIVQLVGDQRLQAVIAALVLFAPASFLLGAISPYLAKLYIASVDTVGARVARLSALNSLGGIAGTFITGFILFSYIGSRETIGLVVVLLLGSSWLLLWRRRWQWRVVITVIIATVALMPLPDAQGVRNLDTPSAHYQVVEMLQGNRPIVGLTTGPGGIQSAVYADGSDELVFWYTSEIARLVEAAEPRRVLMLGGGAFTLPQYLAKHVPRATIDAVEIDPELQGISERYFGYTNPEAVQLIFEDARTYVERAEQQYDVVIVDVFSDTSVPFHLMTREYGEALDRIVAPDGVVIANVIAGTNQACQPLFDAINGAYAPAFSHAVASIDPRLSDPTARGNHVIVYSRAPVMLPGLRPVDLSTARTYSDNYMPAESLRQACAER